MTRWPPAAMAAWDVPTIKQNMNLNIRWVLVYACMCMGVRMNLYFLSQHYMTAHISGYVCRFAHVFVFFASKLHYITWFLIIPCMCVAVCMCFNFCICVYRRVFMGEYVSAYMFLYLCVFVYAGVFVSVGVYVSFLSYFCEIRCWSGKIQGCSINVKKSRKNWPRIYNEIHVYFSTVVSHYTCHILVRTALIRKDGI